MLTLLCEIKRFSILGLWRLKKIFFQMNMRLASVVLQMEMELVRWPPLSLENDISMVGESKNVHGDQMLQLSRGE
jgi:hypothetical protein